MNIRTLLPWLLTCCVLASQREVQAPDTCDLQVVNAPYGVRASGAAAFDGAGRSLAAKLPSGEWQLSFTAGGGGRPASLAFMAPRAGEVIVAIGADPVAHEQPTQHVTESFADARHFGDGDMRDLRVRARIRATAKQGSAGLVARWQDEVHGYRLLWDFTADELRLERMLGGKPWVIGKGKAPAADGSFHDLEIEVQGFHIAAWCDEVLICADLDGALTHGLFGTAVLGDAKVEFANLQSAPPAVAVATLAAIRTAGSLTVTASAPAHPGGVYCLCLRLDCPTVSLPLTGAGFEPFVLQQPVLPIFLTGFGFGSVGRRGEIEATLRWPASLRLMGHAALVGGMLGTPDAGAVAGWLPWAYVQW
jgi:hypothetical protein